MELRLHTSVQSDNPEAEEEHLSPPDTVREALNMSQLPSETAQAPLNAAQNLISSLVSNLGISGSSKKVLVLGAGLVCRPCVQVLSDAGASSTVACRTLETAEKLCSGISKTKAISLDVTKEDALDEQVAAHDVVISLIPYTFHATVIKSAVKNKKNVVTTSYVSDAMRALEKDVKDAGITVMNEIGLDPGIDHLYAVKTIDEVHKQGGKIKTFLSYAGGLPAPENSDNPLGYKFSWSSRGALLALLNSAKYYRDGQIEEIPGDQLMGSAKPFFTGHPGYNFIAYPNRDSTPYLERYSIPEASTCIRGTLRYGGFADMIQTIHSMGFLSTKSHEALSPSVDPVPSWAEATAKVVNAASHREADLKRTIATGCRFRDNEVATRVLDGLRWIGMFSEKEKIVPRDTPLDTLCATLERKMAYAEGERDFIMLQHTFGIEWSGGAKETRTSSLVTYGEPTGPGSTSAMAKCVGVPCAVATLMVLDGRISEKGVLAPLEPELAKMLREEIEKFGIAMVEKIVG